MNENRLKAFSDGLHAIVITIMVADRTSWTRAVCVSKLTTRDEATAAERRFRPKNALQFDASDALDLRCFPQTAEIAFPEGSFR